MSGWSSRIWPVKGVVLCLVLLTASAEENSSNPPPLELLEFLGEWDDADKLPSDLDEADRQDRDDSDRQNDATVE